MSATNKKFSVFQTCFPACLEKLGEQWLLRLVERSLPWCSPFLSVSSHEVLQVHLWGWQWGFKFKKSTVIALTLWGVAACHSELKHAYEMGWSSSHFLAITVTLFLYFFILHIKVMFPWDMSLIACRSLPRVRYVIQDNSSQAPCEGFVLWGWEPLDQGELKEGLMMWFQSLEAISSSVSVVSLCQEWRKDQRKFAEHCFVSI